LTGSLAYDRIMNFSGAFADNILPEQIHNLNVSFFIEDLNENLGGNAGNIAYTLYLLGESSIILSTVGRDFARYAVALKYRGLSSEGLRVVDDQPTACAYIMTDRDNNQITGFHAAAMLKPCGYAFPNLNPADDFALIGPSNPDDMLSHPELYKRKGIRYIYDPSQQLPILGEDALLRGVDGAYMLMGNDYEIQLLMNITGRTKAELLDRTTRGIITTYGEKGSVVTEKGQDEIAIPAVPVGAVLDPTGAGDAFRAGVIKGLLLDQPLAECARLGATCAAYCIEKSGTQTHDFTLDDFFRRHAQAYGHSL
jgi:adenosine kinase